MNIGKVIGFSLYIMVGGLIDSWIYPLIFQHMPSPLDLLFVVALTLGEVGVLIWLISK